MHQQAYGISQARSALGRLPRKLRRELAEKLILDCVPDREIVVAFLERLPAEKQARLTELLDLHEEGQLDARGLVELRRLGREVDRITLANSIAMARALNPEVA